MKKSKKKHAGSVGTSFSNIGQHQVLGKTLQPPLRQLPNATLTSWQDDHLPSVLWAALLTQTLPRDEYLACFREIITHCAPWFDDSGPLRHRADTAPSPSVMNFDAILDFDSLATIADDLFEEFIRIPLAHPLGRQALRPLLFLTTPPGIERWKRSLATEIATEDLALLAGAVARCLNHQSESSTDIRWFKVALPIIAGRMRFGQNLAERAREILDFPNRGDLRSVRPSIRAAEMSMRRQPIPAWIHAFWEELGRGTDCVDPTDLQSEVKLTPSRLNPRNVFGCRSDLIQRFFEVKSTERTDARLDGAFGLTLYALSILITVAATRTQETMLGRLAIRTLVEARVTLAYLAKRDDPKVWSQWRIYGAGQVKLAFLKAQEATGDLPVFYDTEELQRLANEDIWQEYLDIDLGHWTKGNLRWMATECGEKDLYDRFYGWSSGFVHAQWGAVRDTDFVTCHNPLHRLHRIPRLISRRQESVEADAIELTNGMIDLLDGLYKGSQEIRRLRSMPPGERAMRKPSEDENSSTGGGAAA